MTTLRLLEADVAEIAEMSANTGIPVEIWPEISRVYLRIGHTTYTAALTQLGRLPGEPRPAQHDEPQAA